MPRIAVSVAALLRVLAGRRVALTIAVLLGLLAGGGAVYVFQPKAPVTDAAAVRYIVSEMLVEREASEAPINIPPVDAATINPMIEDFLISNPRLLERMSNALQLEVRTAEAAAAKEAIGKLRSEIFDAPGQIVLGNPTGDVTLVEMFDYNCGFCRSALPDLATLIAEDPNLRVILKEFPILSAESVDAARVAVLVSEAGADYWAFHQALFTSRGQVNKEVAMAAAKDVGLNPVSLELEFDSQAVTDTIQRSYDIAKGLNVSGTPTYIIGDEVIPGAVGLDLLRKRIANMRECGETVCETAS